MFELVPRDEKFFDQIEQLSALTKSAELLGEIIRSFPNYGDLSARVQKAGTQAGEIMQATLCRLDDAFIP